MKKLALLALVVAGFTMTSCKKEYECECYSYNTGATYDKTGKGKDAADACDDAEEKTLGISQEECLPK